MRSFTLFICLVSCCVMSLVKAAPIGFDVGTAPGKADVIFNGTALPGWDGLNINTSRVNILPYQVVFTLYVRWNDGITPNNTFPNNTFANTTIANATQGFNVTSSITSLILFGNKVSISQNQSSGVLHVGVDWEIDLGFQNCISYYDAYSGLVNLTFHFESPTADDVTIQFGKICQWPPVYIAGPPSTPSNLTALAVVNGSAVRGYNYVSPPNVDTDVFYMWLPTNLSYYPYANISLRPSGQPWFNVPTWMSMSWEQSSNTVYPSNVGYTTVTVRYICNDTLPANSATVGVVFDTGCDSVLLLYWTKNCSYGTGIQTPSVFYVDAYHQSVVQGGTPRGLWNDTGYGLPANTHEFEFSVYINDTTRYGLTTLNFTISGDSVDDNPVFIINNGMLTNYVAHLYNGFKQTNNTNNTATTVPVMITCLRAGLGNGSITFDFGEQYYPVTVYLSYTCTQPYFDVDHVSDDGHIIDRIISSNIPLSWNYISPPTSTQELFRIMLTTQTKDTVQDVNIANIAYNSTVMSAPAVFLDDVPLNLSTWFPLQVGFANTTRVVLTCYDNQPFTTTWVNITVNYGWNQTQRIAFQKTCPYPSSTSSSTLATGYIVLIAVGSFFALFCCTCAGYKYTKQEKRGCDVLPGIGLLRACYQCACPTKEYLTQTDGDDYHGNVPAGKSYQSTDNK